MSQDNKIARRNFLTGAALATTAGALSAEDVSAQERPVETPPPEITTMADVLVVGGGTAGTVAAIQSARAGAKTFIVERGAQLGGTTTTGGVSFPGLFDAWGKQIVRGIGWELVRECVELDEGTFPDFRKVPQHHWMNQVRVNQFLYAILAEEKCAQAGVEQAYYEFPYAIEETLDGWQVDCVGFGTERRVLCKQIIDCTGGAEVVGMLGLPRLRESETQPSSILFRLGVPNQPGRPNKDGSGLLDSIYVHGGDSSNSRTVTDANLQGRRDVLAMVRSSKKRLMHLQPEVGFRESYRIVGETKVTMNDYTSGRVFSDAVSYAFYPVDLHTKDGVQPKPLKPGTVPTIPRSALVPKGSRNIVVAGRSVSSDRFANSGLRVQASCMGMGQAAGAMSALAAKEGVTPLSVSIEDLHSVLRAHDAIVPETA